MIIIILYCLTITLQVQVNKHIQGYRNHLTTPLKHLMDTHPGMPTDLLDPFRWVCGSDG